ANTSRASSSLRSRTDSIFIPAPIPPGRRVRRVRCAIHGTAVVTALEAWWNCNMIAEVVYRYGYSREVRYAAVRRAHAVAGIAGGAPHSSPAPAAIASVARQGDTVAMPD